MSLGARAPFIDQPCFASAYNNGKADPLRGK